jgi:hypothetical protein
MNKLIENLIFGIVTTAVLTALPTLTFAQISWTTAPPVRPEATVAPQRPESRIQPTTQPYPRPDPRTFGTSEKAIKVDGSVNLTLKCVVEGTIKINGWNRNEVRVLIEDGSNFGFKILQKSAKTGDPIWIQLIGIDGKKGKYGPTSECISGSEIEIDVPMSATVNIQGNEITTTVDSVKKVEVKTIGGDISLRKVSNGITANAGQGDITVEESAGSMKLDTSEGNILVFEAGPSEPGDIFKANTHSGTISLQQLVYRQVDVRTITGSVAFSGEVLSAGSYNLNTTNGSIRMALPQTTSCKVKASYGYGSFNPEIPFKISTENILEGPIKSVVGTLGKGGDAVLILSTVNGSISIKKL